MIKTIAHVLLVVSILLFCIGGPAGFTFLFNKATGLDIQNSGYTWAGSILFMVFLLYLAKREDNNVHTKS